MTFWERTKEQIILQRTTFRWIACQMGVGESTVSTWRRTEVLPRADHAARIAELLGVSVEYLVTGKEHAEPETRETEREILKEMHALSDNELKTVLGLVRNLVDNRYDGSHQKQTAG